MRDLGEMYWIYSNIKFEVKTTAMKTVNKHNFYGTWGTLLFSTGLHVSEFCNLCWSEKEMYYIPELKCLCKSRLQYCIWETWYCRRNLDVSQWHPWPHTTCTQDKCVIKHIKILLVLNQALICFWSIRKQRFMDIKSRKEH